ncbi:hypothetical protein Pmani_014849 [Petrolisthes manimaculis]|uniref:Uncharacterized protein n=1 Tax=Petrolisthes manimaculis TaxID=1843537 RepID=A0AAE1PTE9_9EUCA|nr:hypothetical protein Pmani_014849 [Petrolisthes manimaculis]
MAKVSETKTIPRNQLENLRKSELVDMIITMRDDEGTANITKKLTHFGSSCLSSHQKRTRRCAEVYCSHYRHSHTIHQAVFCSENQVNELVLGLHEHRGGVLQEFSHMKTIDPSVEQQSGVSSLGLAEKGTRLMKGSQGREEGLQEIADYLSPRLLGILGFLDSKLVSSSTMYKEKR